MKQLFVILTLLVTVTLNAQELTVEQHLEDFDIVVSDLNQFERLTVTLKDNQITVE